MPGRPAAKKRDVLFWPSSSVRCRRWKRPKITCQPKTRSCRRSSFPRASPGARWPRPIPRWSSRTSISTWSVRWSKRRSVRKLGHPVLRVATRSSSGCWPRCAARSATRAWSSARRRSCRGPRARRWPGATATARTRRRSWWPCSAWPAFAAHVALLRTGRYGDVVPSLPGLGDFDHAIVYIPGDPAYRPAGTRQPAEAVFSPGAGSPGAPPRPIWIDPSARCARPDTCRCWTRTVGPCSPAPRPAS